MRLCDTRSCRLPVLSRLIVSERKVFFFFFLKFPRPLTKVGTCEIVKMQSLFCIYGEFKRSFFVRAAVQVELSAC